MMIGRLRDLTRTMDGKYVISAQVEGDPRDLFDALKDAEIDIDIKKHRNKRSLDANAFCWALCSEIGKAMTPPQSKEDIYRTAIRAAGVFWSTPVPAFHLDTIRRRWEDRGCGWFIDVIDDAEPGRKLVHMYFGTSTYTVDEMRVLLDWLVDTAQQMEIPIPLSKKEEDELLERWGMK